MGMPTPRFKLTESLKDITLRAHPSALCQCTTGNLPGNNTLVTTKGGIADSEVNGLVEFLVLIER